MKTLNEFPNKNFVFESDAEKHQEKGKGGITALFAVQDYVLVGFRSGGFRIWRGDTSGKAVLAYAIAPQINVPVKRFVHDDKNGILYVAFDTLVRSFEFRDLGQNLQQRDEWTHATSARVVSLHFVPKHKLILIVWEENSKGPISSSPFRIDWIDTIQSTRRNTTFAFGRSLPRRTQILDLELDQDSIVIESASTFNISFTTWLLSEKLLGHWKFVSPASRILNYIADRGPDSLAEHKVHVDCIQAGLLPPPTEDSEAPALVTDSNENSYYLDLFDVCLQNNLISVICQLLTKQKRVLLPTSAMESGILYHLEHPRLVQIWAWDRFETVRAALVNGESLLDAAFVNGDHDPEVIKTLDEAILQLYALGDVFSTLFSRASEATDDDELASLSAKVNTVMCLTQHVELVQWLAFKKLFPETAPSSPLAYNFDNAFQKFQQRRKARRDLYYKNEPGNGQGDELEDAFYKHELFVNTLAESLAGSSGKLVFPPKNLQSFLHALHNGNDVSAEDVIKRRCLIYYFLLDTSPTMELDGDHQNLLEEFGSKFNLSLAYQHLVYGFWLLDSATDSTEKSDLDSKLGKALNEFSDPYVNVEWGNKILRTFYDLGGLKEALEFYRRTLVCMEGKRDEICVVDVLLANGCLEESVAFARSHAGQRGHAAKELWQRILQHCLRKNHFEQLFRLHLNPEEQQFLIKFFRSGGDGDDERAVQLRRYLVVFLLQRRRFIEAAEEFRYARTQSERDGRGGSVLGIMVENFQKLLPPDQISSALHGVAVHPDFEMKAITSNTQMLKLFARPPSSSFVANPGGDLKVVWETADDRDGDQQMLQQTQTNSPRFHQYPKRAARWFGQVSSPMRSSSSSRKQAKDKEFEPEESYKMEL